MLRALKLFHGKRGAGLSVEFKVRYGPITILGVTQTADGALKLSSRRGRVDPGPDVPDRQHELPPALRARRPAEFFERWCAEGPTHHVALGVGHRGEVRNVARLLGLEFAVVG